MKRTGPVDNPGQPYVNFDAVTGTSGSVPDAQDIDGPASEITNLIEAMGLTADPADFTQLQAAIGLLVTALGYLRKDLSDTIEVGYPLLLDDLGDASAAAGGTITLDFAKPPLKTLAIDGDVQIDPPAAGNGICAVVMTNDGTGGHLPTWPNITITAGSYDDTATVVNILRIEKVGALVTGEIRTVPQ